MPYENPDALAAMLGGGCLIFALLLATISIVVLIFYILSMQKALDLAGAQHRKMDPPMVWLMLIPLFNLVWHFFVVKAVAESIQGWAGDSGIQVGDAGYTIGLVACIAYCCAIVPILNILAWPVSLVCFIIWWVKVAGFNKAMAARA